MGYASDLSWYENGNYDQKRFVHFPTDLTDFDETSRSVKISDPDLIIHLAAESHVDRSLENPRNFIESNIIGTFNLLNATKNHFFLLKDSRKENFIFHHVSTDEVFGSLGPVNQFNEKTKYDPKSPYSASKASSDHLVRAWNSSFNLPVVISNCSNNYGPYQFPEKLIPLAITKALKDEFIPIYGKGKNIRDWLFVEDHVDALNLVAHKGKKGESYCIGGFGEKSNNEIINLICEILDELKPNGFKYKALIKYVEDRPGHDFRYSINSSKIQKELGWEPKFNLRDGLRKTILWYLENQNWVEYMHKKSFYNGQRLGKVGNLKKNSIQG